MRFPSRSVSRAVRFFALVFSLSLAGCGAATTRSGGEGGGKDAGAGGARATGGSAMTGGASGSAGARATGGAAGNGGAAGIGGGGGARSCDSDGDGLDDVAGCVTAPVYLRFVNATSAELFDVYVAGAARPVAAGLAAYQVATVGPVQAKLLDYEFRVLGASATSPTSSLAGETLLQVNDRLTLTAYLDRTGDAGTLRTNAALQPSFATCSLGTEIDIGAFTTLVPPPIVVFYTTGQGTSWMLAVSPGLEMGQIRGSGCWNAGQSIQLGIGPMGAAAPTYRYQAVTFTNTTTYQLLLTDDRIIEIDNLDQVSNVPRQP